MNINEQCLLNFLNNPDRFDANLLKLEDYLFYKSELNNLSEKDNNLKNVVGR